MAEASIKVAVEGVIHAALRDLINQIARDYNIRIDRVTVDWSHRLGQPIVMQLHVDTSTG